MSTVFPSVTPPGPNSTDRTCCSEVQAPMMGTTTHVVLLGEDAPPTDQVIAQLDSYESAWSRFRPGAELTRLGADNGSPTVVSHPTAMLIERAVWAWRRTGGRFDPTVLQAVRDAGYDRTFAELDPPTESPKVPLVVSGDLPVASDSDTATPGCDGIEVDPRVDLVRLPSGVGIDPGGIGKGLAADLAATSAVDLGATGAMVSIGGDLRVGGEPPAEGWEIELDHHVVAPARINLVDGAIATSTTLRRRWATPHGVAHHVIDPRTGRPSSGALVAVSVVAGEAWWAEALATALLVDWVDPGAEPELLELLEAAGALLTFADGAQRAVGAFATSFSFGGDI